jgi:Flp pilus assembly CpaE family ATPase
LIQVGCRVVQTASGKEGLVLAWRDLPQAIVLEMDLPDIDALEVVRKLRRDRRTRYTPILGLTSLRDPQRMAAGEEAGLTDYILKRPEALGRLLRRLGFPAPEEAAPRAETVPAGAALVAFLSANPGQGTSTLCANLASELARLRPEAPLAVLDLAPSGAGMSGLMGVEPAGDWAALLRDPDRGLTTGALGRVLRTADAWGFVLLSLAAGSRVSGPLDSDHLGRLLDALLRKYSLVLADVGYRLTDTATALVRRASLVVVVFSPDADDAANTQVLLRYLIAEGVSERAIWTLSNERAGFPAIDEAALREALGREVDAHLPDLGPELTASINRRLPLGAVAPESRAGRSLRETADLLMRRLQPGT